MRIERFYIRKFKNLTDFEAVFDPSQLTTVLLGRNGTGKSNVIEALVLVFRHLDLGLSPGFGYQLTYECRQQTISINADRDDQRIDVQVRGQVATGPNHLFPTEERQKQFFMPTKGLDAAYLPSVVFGYYSGPSNRLQKHFDRHQDNFYKALINSENDSDEEPLRRLFYTRLIHSQFVLLAFFAFNQPKLRSFLQQYLGIVALESVLFVLHEPDWAKNNKRRSRDDLFWGARGVVRPFLDALYEESLAPIKTTDKEAKFYLYIQDQEALQRLAHRYQVASRFFKRLESTYISKLIEEVRIRVKKENVEGYLTFTELSEGEQQLLTVLGLLEFTKDDEAIFLLDEPDTHLNPAWKLEYMKLLEDVVEMNRSSQIVLTTHDPIVIGGLLKEQVRVLARDDEGQIECYEPAEDPRGMGISALLTSELYGLPTALDLETQKLLDDKAVLLVKQRTEGLTEQESAKLVALSEQMQNLGFSTSVDDPMYTDFLVAMTEYQNKRTPDLTPGEREEQKHLAAQVIQELLEERKQRDALS